MTKETDRMMEEIQKSGKTNNIVPTLFALSAGLPDKFNPMIPKRKRPKTLNVVKQGKLNQKCTGCGHKNKKCTCSQK